MVECRPNSVFIKSNESKASRYCRQDDCRSQLVVWDGFTDGYKVMPPIERLELVAKLIQESGIFTTDETYRRIGVIQTQTFAEFNEQMQMLDEDSPLSFDEYKAVVYERHLPDAPAKKKDFVTRNKILAYLRVGNTFENACKRAKITVSTGYNWRREDDEFNMDVESAEAESEGRDVAAIDKAGEKYWQAKAWKLERRNPKDWGKSIKISPQDMTTEQMIQYLERSFDNRLTGNKPKMIEEPKIDE